MWWKYKPYVSVAQRRAKAAKQIAKMEKKGAKASPVRIEGRKIARTFWGGAWCDHLESYSDYANRLPRGRTYVRNGSVVDLKIEPGQITALVAGSDLYKIKIGIKPAGQKAWDQIKARCAGQIGSLIELLQGKLSQGVMQIITERNGGLFPKPAEIDLNCSCPDWAGMCKHVSAALYGVGARLDERPELLFLLRKLDHFELITQAGDLKGLPKGARKQKTIAAEELAGVFGIDIDATQQGAPPPLQPVTAPPRRTPNRKAATQGKATRSTSRKTRERVMPELPVPPDPSPKRSKKRRATAMTPLARIAEVIERKQKNRSTLAFAVPGTVAVQG